MKIIGPLSLMPALLLGVATPGGEAAPRPPGDLETRAATVLARNIMTEWKNQLAEMETKVLDLAEAIPPEEYGWRPAEGVRSISETLVHVIMANYWLPSFLGYEKPDDLTSELEATLTEKAAVTARLRASFEHVRKVANDTHVGNLESEVELFGSTSNRFGLLLRLQHHGHEHLGQLIAYARSRGVVPPWSRTRAGHEK